MSGWRDVLSAMCGWGLTVLLAGVAAYGMVQGWLEEQPSRSYTTAGFGVMVLVCVLLWNRLALWSRPVLILTYLFALVAAMAFIYSPRDAGSFALGPFSLVVLVNGVVLLGLLLAASVLLRMRWLPTPIRVLVGLLAGVCAYPYALGVWREIPLPDLFLGAGMPLDLPLWTQPSVLGVIVFLPVAGIFLLAQLVRSLRQKERSTLRALLLLVAGLVPLEIAGSSLAPLALPELAGGRSDAPVFVGGTSYESGELQLTEHDDVGVRAGFSLSLPEGWSVHELERTPAEDGSESGTLAVAFVAPDGGSTEGKPERIIVQLRGLPVGGLAAEDYFATEDQLVAFLMPRHQMISEDRLELPGFSESSKLAATNIEPTGSTRLRTYTGKSRFGKELVTTIYTAGGLGVSLNIALVADAADHAALEAAAAPVLDTFRIDISSEGPEIR